MVSHSMQQVATAPTNRVCAGMGGADGAARLPSSISSSDSCYGEEVAPDLVVEASPPQREDPQPDDHRGGDASYFSDFDPERNTSELDKSFARTPLFRGDESAAPADRAGLAGTAGDKECLRYSSDDKVAWAVDDEEDLEADEYCGVDVWRDAVEHTCAMTSCSDAAAAATTLSPPDGRLKSKSSVTPQNGKSERSGSSTSSWMDPSQILTTSRSLDVSSGPWPMGGATDGCEGLSESPLRPQERDLPQRRDASPYAQGPLPLRLSSSVTVREGTAAPPPHHLSPHPPLTSRSGCSREGGRGGKGALHSSRTASATPLRTSMLATSEAVPVARDTRASPPRRSSADTYGDPAQSNTAEHVSPWTGGFGDFPSKDGDSTAASPPPRRPLSTKMRTPAPHPRVGAPRVDTTASSVADTTHSVGYLTRVVRERPPRSAPLLRRCTGHISTPTRVILVSPESSEESGDDETVTAGLHTSPYREAKECSDFSSSPEGDVPQMGARASEAERRHPQSFGVAKAELQTARRSSSPWLSLTDMEYASSRAPDMPYLPRHRADPTNVPSPSESTGTLLDDGSLDFFHFSVHTEALDASRQEEETGEGSIPVLRAYFLERIGGPASLEGAQAWPASPQGPCLPRPATASTALKTIPLPAKGFLNSQSPLMKYTSHDAPSLRSEPIKETLRESSTVGIVEPTLEKLGPLRHPAGKLLEHPQGRARLDAERSHDVFLHHSGTSLENASHFKRDAEDSKLRIGTAPVGVELCHLHHGAVADSPTAAKACCFDTSPPLIAEEKVGGTASMPAFSGKGDLAAQTWERKEALRNLLARQAPSTCGDNRGMTSLGSPGVLRGTVDSSLLGSSMQLVITREQLRAERVAFEAERARLSLTLDVCLALRPHARDLLLLFLLQVEESNTRRGRGRRRRPWGDATVDSDQLEESRVTYQACAEAVNCVLERHGVRWVRATRELCHRLVRWCRSRGQPGPECTLVAAIPDKVDPEGGRVEYATFVSCVLEFAALYRSSGD